MRHEAIVWDQSTVHHTGYKLLSTRHIGINEAQWIAMEHIFHNLLPSQTQVLPLQASPQTPMSMTTHRMTPPHTHTPDSFIYVHIQVLDWTTQTSICFLNNPNTTCTCIASSDPATRLPQFALPHQSQPPGFHLHNAPSSHPATRLSVFLLNRKLFKSLSDSKHQ